VSSEPELTVDDHLRLADELFALSAWSAAARPDDGLAVGWAVTKWGVDLRHENEKGRLCIPHVRDPMQPVRPSLCRSSWRRLAPLRV